MAVVALILAHEKEKITPLCCLYFGPVGRIHLGLFKALF